MPTDKAFDKAGLIAHLITRVTEKTTRAHVHVDEIRSSLLNENKSSAGDKHETSRAMAQIELEKASKNAGELDRVLQVLRQMSSLTGKQKQIALGTLIQCTNFYIFVSVGLGEIEWQGSTVYTSSFNAPLIQLLRSKKQGDSFQFNGKEEHILALL